MDHQTNEAVAR